MAITILQLFLPEVAALLKLAVKNPSNYANLKGILTEIQADLSTILAGM